MYLEECRNSLDDLQRFLQELLYKVETLKENVDIAARQTGPRRI